MKSNFNNEGEATVSLAELLPGESGRVIRVADESAADRRLMDLGLLPETPVRVLRRSPLGDPTVYELRGYRLCLREVDAARVRVRPDPGRAAPARVGRGVRSAT
jgi:ferrous iron transport protein A